MHTSNTDRAYLSIERKQETVTVYGSNYNNHTPLSKSAFKSPIPSAKKIYLEFKSPMPTSTMCMGKVINDPSYSLSHSSEQWMISPVCSRLRDHITALNGSCA